MEAIVCTGLSMHFPVASGNLDLCFWESRRGLGIEYTCEHRSSGYNIQILSSSPLCSTDYS